MIVLFAVGVIVVATLAAMVLYDAGRSRRSAQFEEHLDRHMDALTEQRIRRNLNQGG